MLRHSYQVLLKENQAQLLGLQIDLEKNPGNQKIEGLIAEKTKQIAWIEKEIQEGRDPGVHIL